MTEVAFRPRARADLDEVADYSATRLSIDQADEYVGRIDETWVDIAHGHVSGRSASDIRPGLPSYPVRSYLVFYRIRESGGIEVIRVLHQRMDPRRRF